MAEADTRLVRTAIRSLEELGRNGYKMVTKDGSGKTKLLEGKPLAVSDDGN
jgi:hypothetical protein